MKNDITTTYVMERTYELYVIVSNNYISLD